MRVLITLFCLALLGGCATAKDSALLGAGVGGVVGAGMGAAAGSPHGKEGKGALVGAAAGAAIGGLAGWLDHTQKGKGDSQSLSLIDGSGEAPALTTPQVRRVWVPDRIENNKFIRGHFIYVIERPSSWRMDDEDQGDKKNGK